MWNKLQEWKRIIALLYWCIATPLMPLWFSDSKDANKIYISIGITLSAIGVSSALAKKYQDKITNEIQSN